MNKSNLLKLIGMAVCFVIVLVLSLIIYFCKNNPPQIDLAIRDFAYSIRGDKYGFIYWFNRVITEFGHFYVVIFILLLFIIRTKFDYRSILAVVGGLLCLALVLGLKEFYDRLRPDEAQRWMTEVTFSFPSGHAAMSGFLYTYLIYVVWHEKDFKLWFKRCLYVFYPLLIFLVASSRIILGVHYFSDVIVGYFVGLLVSFLTMYVSKFFVVNNILQKGLFEIIKKKDKND